MAGNPEALVSYANHWPNKRAANATNATPASKTSQVKVSASASVSKSSAKPSDTSGLPHSIFGIIPSATSVEYAGQGPTHALPAAKNQQSPGLSSGAIAGICIGVVAVLGVAAMVLLMRRRRRQRQHKASSNQRVSKVIPTIGAPNMMAIHSPNNTYGSTVVAGSTMPVAGSTMPATDPSLVVVPLDPPADQDTELQNPWEQPPLGTYTITATYTPTMDDELEVRLGDRVEIYVEYDDGWCLGINLTRNNRRGVFPLHCVRQPSNDVQQFKRRSSIRDSRLPPLV